MNKKIVLSIKYISIALLLYSAFVLLTEMVRWMQFSETKTELIEIQTHSVEEKSFNVFDNLKSMNDDYIAWISIDDTDISYPIVLGKDNKYYLNHDFYGNVFAYGSIFMDYRNKSDFSDANIAIYGHAARYKAMFGYLNEYLDEEFLKNHSIIKIQFKDEVKEFRIFSVYVVDATITGLDIPSDIKSIDELKNMYQSQSYVDTEVDISHATQVLSLVSCNYSIENGRIIVQAIPINP